MIGKIERANGYYEIIEMFADGGNVGQVKSILKKQYGFELPLDCDSEHDDKIWKTERDVLLYEHGAENIQEISFCLSACFNEEQNNLIEIMRDKLIKKKEKQLENYLDHEFFYDIEQLDIEIRGLGLGVPEYSKVEPDCYISFPVVDLNDDSGHDFNFSKSYFLETFPVLKHLKPSWFDGFLEHYGDSIRPEDESDSPFYYLLYRYYKHKFNEIGGEKMLECMNLMLEIERLRRLTYSNYKKDKNKGKFIEMIFFVLEEHKFEIMENTRNLYKAYKTYKFEMIKRKLAHYKQAKTLIYDLKKEVEEHLQKEKKEKENERNELDNYQIPRNYRIINNGSRFIVQKKETILWIFSSWKDMGDLSTEYGAKEFIQREVSGITYENKRNYTLNNRHKYK